MDNKQKEVQLADDEKDEITLLLRLRLPWLVGGLIIGGFITLFISRFEEILSDHIALAFFIPFIVYMSDAVGTQTEAIYVRYLATGRGNFIAYLSKEFSLGIALGLMFGLAVFLFGLLVFRKFDVALTVGLAMSISLTIAPLVAMTTSQTIKKLHKDPAVGSGPFATVIQDFLTVIIYFLVASVVILGRV